MKKQEKDLPYQNGIADKEAVDNELAVAEEDIIPKEMEDVLNSIPDKAQAQAVRTILSMQFRAVSASPESAVSKKITEEHISKYLEDSGSAMRETYKEMHEDKIFKGFVILVACAMVIAVIILLKEQPDVMEKIIYAFVGLLAGSIGGYGAGYKKGLDN